MNTEMDRSSKRRSATGFIENLNVAVRENPVAAALIGVGISWAFFRGSRMSDFGLAGTSQKVARVVGSKAAGASKTVAAGFQAAGAGVSELVQDVGETVASAARKATDFSNPVGDSSSVSREGALDKEKRRRVFEIHPQYPRRSARTSALTVGRHRSCDRRRNRLDLRIHAD